MRLLAKEPTQITVTTDASGAWGCGGYTSPSGQWFLWQWDDMISCSERAVSHPTSSCIIWQAVAGMHSLE